MDQRTTFPTVDAAPGSDPARPPFPARGKNPKSPGHGAARLGTAPAPAELHLVQRVFGHCHALITEACARSSVPPEFLGALVGNESGGHPGVARFEPSVYRHLEAVAKGRSPAYGGILARDLADEIEEILHPKAASFHARYLTDPFVANNHANLEAMQDEALRELATSWGFTQIMGYHMVGREGTPRDLLSPSFHFRLAVEILAEFAEDYHLDLAHEFCEMFCCWNTGTPYGRTFDPHYVENGLRRLDLYRRVSLIGRS